MDITIKFQDLETDFIFTLNDREVSVLHQTQEQGYILLIDNNFHNLIHYQFLERDNPVDTLKFKLGWRGRTFLGMSKKYEFS